MNRLRGLLGATFLGACASGMTETPQEATPRDEARVPEAASAAAAPEDRAPAAAPASFDLEPLRRIAKERDAADDVARSIVAGAEASIPLLVAGLRGDAAAPAGAVLCLQVLPREAVPAVLPLLDDADEKVRRRALWALLVLVDWWAADEGKAGSAVIDALVAGIARAGPEERAKRVEVLRHSRRCDARVVRGLTPWVETADGDLLDDIARLLADAGPAARSLAPALQRRLDAVEKTGGDPILLRLELERALRSVELPDRAALDEMVARLDDPERCEEALATLGSWGDRAAGAVGSILPFLSHEARMTRRAAFDALLRIPGGGLPATKAAIERAAGWAKDSEKEPWVEDLDALGPRWTEVLPWLEEQSANEDVDLRVAALLAIGRLPADAGPAALPTLLRALSSDSARTRAAATASWFRLRPWHQDDVGTLTRALRDPSAAVRRAALVEAEDSRRWNLDRDAAALVAPLLLDPDDDVKVLAADALLAIGIAPPRTIDAVCTNLRSDDRRVRLGAVRIARMLGPEAAPAIPQLLALAKDYDLGPVALDALAATEVMDERMREGIATAAAEGRKQLLAAYGAFGPRAQFLEERARAFGLEATASNGLLDLARGSRGSPDFVAWLETNSRRFRSGDIHAAVRACGPAGLRWLLADAARDDHVRTELRRHVRSLGDVSIPPLVGAVRDTSPAEAALALGLLVDEFPVAADPLLAGALASEHSVVRAAGMRGVAQAARRGAPGAASLDVVRAGLRDVPAVRAAAFDVVAAARPAGEDVREAARAGLTDPDPDVRVAAAGAVVALAGDAASVLPLLRAELNLPTPSWSWNNIGHGPARPEDDYSAKERRWVAVARVLSAMGPAAAPAAEDLAWAALRHGDPGLGWRLVAAIEPMGRGAAGAGRLLVRRARDPDLPWLPVRHGDDPQRLREAVRRALRAAGVEVPEDLTRPLR